MNNPTTLLLIAFVMLSIVTFAQNQQDTTEIRKARDDFQSLLKETDKNNDGKISKDEFLAKFKDKKIGENKYNELDLNKDGVITENEYVKATLKLEDKEMDEEEEEF